MNYLITGGAGFVGSSLALKLKERNFSDKVIALDNLKRRGSELNLSRLKSHGIAFIHGDIRNYNDLESAGPVDVILECSAEPSVLAGYHSSPDYVVNTNLLGTVNCLKLAAKYKANFMFLSTSRVYPFPTINSLNIQETETRYELSEKQVVQGCSAAGINEEFPLSGIRSLYGATKLASELLVQEYADLFGFKTIINRCGVIAGPWQFGKADQGVVALWAARHFWKQSLDYIGFGGAGKQVRDLLHVDDLFRLLEIQMNDWEKCHLEVFNVGGGREVSVSLQELTRMCQEYTGNTIDIKSVADNRPADIKLYLTDNGKVTGFTGWKPSIPAETIVKETSDWIRDQSDQFESILK